MKNQRRTAVRSGKPTRGPAKQQAKIESSDSESEHEPKQQVPKQQAPINAVPHIKKILIDIKSLNKNEQLAERLSEILDRENSPFFVEQACDFTREFLNFHIKALID